MSSTLPAVMNPTAEPSSAQVQISNASRVKTSHLVRGMGFQSQGHQGAIANSGATGGGVHGLGARRGQSWGNSGIRAAAGRAEGA